MMNAPTTLFDDLASPDSAAQHGMGDWAAVRAGLESAGIAVTPPLLSEAECREARAWFDDPGRFRSTVVMQRYGFGRGTYRFVDEAAPEQVAAIGGVRVVRRHETPDHRVVAVRSNCQVGVDGALRAADHGGLVRVDAHDMVLSADSHARVPGNLVEKCGPHKLPCRLLERAVNCG